MHNSTLGLPVDQLCAFTHWQALNESIAGVCINTGNNKGKQPPSVP
jgi:hypothetical protein